MCPFISFRGFGWEWGGGGGGGGGGVRISLLRDRDQPSHSESTVTDATVVTTGFLFKEKRMWSIARWNALRPLREADVLFVSRSCHSRQKQHQPKAYESPTV